MAVIISGRALTFLGCETTNPALQRHFVDQQSLHQQRQRQVVTFSGQLRGISLDPLVDIQVCGPPVGVNGLFYYHAHTCAYMCAHTQAKLTQRSFYAHMRRVKHFGKKPARKAERTNLTIRKEVKSAAILYAERAGFDSLSALVVDLLERELRSARADAALDSAVGKARESAGEGRVSRRATGKRQQV